MTWHRFIAITCDKCGEEYEVQENTVKLVRRWARDDGGWVYRDGQDLCPVCRDELKATS